MDKIQKEVYVEADSMEILERGRMAAGTNESFPAVRNKNEEVSEKSAE